MCLQQEKQVPHTTTRQEQHHKQTNTRTNPPTPHSTTLKRGAPAVRTTTHARVGGRAEVSVGGKVEVRRALGRARVRRATAGPLRTRQLEGSRDHAGDAASAAAVRCDKSGDSSLRRLGPGLPPVFERRETESELESHIERGTRSLGLYKIFVHFNAFVNSTCPPLDQFHVCVCSYPICIMNRL